MPERTRNVGWGFMYGWFGEGARTLLFSSPCALAFWPSSLFSYTLTCEKHQPEKQSCTNRPDIRRHCVQGQKPSSHLLAPVEDTRCYTTPHPAPILLGPQPRPVYSPRARQEQRHSCQPLAHILWRALLSKQRISLSKEDTI
ncbi:hypothetical protein GQ54DRAFT_93936 [Martensiomyces pterosporus]|nr:hypothetical protein GQ54DRAFT_93936 [Martensiomyces pterosporus]